MVKGKTKTSLDFNYVKPCFDLLQFSYNFMTKGFSYSNRFVTPTINFLTRGSEDLTLSYIRNKTMTKLKMTMNFDNLNNVTSSKLKKVND